MSRAAGILMPITSLPTDYGIGTIGKEAYDFADFLKGAGQKYWQILPVGPTSYGDSPYQSFSTFAGNPYLIDLDMLSEEGLLKSDEYKALDWGDDDTKVDYAKIYNNRFGVLRLAFERFKETDQKDFKKWCTKNKSWLDNYSLYMAVKGHFDNKAWTEWEDESIRLRTDAGLKKYKRSLSKEVAFWKFVQFKFYEQWEAFRAYVNSLGIQIIGDMPIYVAMDSADTWANPEVFWLTEERQPVCVAGCPPDYFSATGQLWGNPLYDWKYLEETGYEWWFKRIDAASKLFDITRIDHFRAFDSYYAIPFPAENAVNGSWMEGPGIKFFEQMKKKLGDIPIIAEDLGTMTPGVIQLLKDSGYPGMKVLEFAFDSDEENDYLPHTYTPNSVVYTGTHDNDTLIGWAATAPESSVGFARSYCKMPPDEPFNWGIIRTAYESVSDYCLIQMQDLLGLGSEARMNTPSTLGGNWEWRITKRSIPADLGKKIRTLTKTYGRLEDKPVEKKKSTILEKLELTAKTDYCKEIEELSAAELHESLGKAIMGEIADRWTAAKNVHANNRRAYYFSAEFLMGRMMYNNLFCLGILDEVKSMLKKKGIDINVFEDIDDAALGNGGLGRLAACFLDSAATQDVPLDGYGIRYKYGLFKQGIVNGFQVETADDWQRFGDPWCIRRNDDAVQVKFADQTVIAVPYDMAVIGYGTENINTLRLWEAEAVENFDFLAFNNFDYAGSVKAKNDAEDITKVLYPNDNRHEGKVLRLKQQYFFCSASLQDIVKRYKSKYGNDYSKFSQHAAIQLNDTHPVVAIPELIRLLKADGLTFEQAFEIAQKTFAYTNHTVMSEALEKWNIDLMKSVIPEIYTIIEKINERLINDLSSKCNISNMKIIDGGVVHMARLAVYASSYTNGVAWIHTEILKNDVLNDWYKIYPERFQNKTNGITQRRWLGLCNPELSELITENIGDGWLRDLSELKKFEEKINAKTIKQFNKIKLEKKKQLADFIEKSEGIKLDPNFIFDIQVKRLHEYKRQLLNAFSIMSIYFKLKNGELPNWQPTAFIFGAKAAPGYARAKAIIKYINEIANLVNNDPDVCDKIKVVFVHNYNVSYAEKIVTAADFSEQISTAGTEASGTGNMKFMLNGAVTLGTYDGANVEIAQEAGEENEYIFGARVEEIDKLKAENSYNARAIYDSNPEIKRVIDTLVNGTFRDGVNHNGEGSFAELHNSLINGASWHAPDHYFILLDLPSYVDAKIKANADYANREEFGKKCLINTANAGKFSSDRTILQYAKELWKVKD